MITNDDIDGSSLEEFDCSISEKELSQIINDENLRARIKTCPICSNEYIDDSYFGEATCGLKNCEEQYERLHGKKKKRKKLIVPSF